MVQLFDMHSWGGNTHLIPRALLQPKFDYFLGGENRKMEQIVQVRKARFPRTLLEKTRGGKNV